MRGLAVLAFASLATVSPGHRTAGSADRSPRIVVVVSADAAPYQDALAGLKRELSGSQATLVIVSLHGDSTRADEWIAAIRGGAATHAPTDAVVTLGTLATRVVLARIHDLPVIAGMIWTTAELGDATNATAAYLEYPVEVELDWFTRILPGSRRVGVVYHSTESAGRVETARRLVKLEAIRIDAPADLPDALHQLANRADVLWSVNDPLVYNPQTARSLLLFSLRNRIPMVGQSTAWVRAGALYALERDYQDVGAQCALLTTMILSGTAPAQVAPVPPRKVRYAINARTAADLGVALPDALLRGAAEVVH